MNAKRKSTLGTRRNTEAPSRLTTIFNLLPEFETNDGPRNQNRTQLGSKSKQPRSNRVPTQTSSNRGGAKKQQPVNRVLYKRTALKPTNSTAVPKESPPCPESLKRLMARSKLLDDREETTALTGGLRMMRERTARARAARILSTPNSTNIARNGEIMGNKTPKMPSYVSLAQITPQNPLLTKHKSDFPCSADRSNIPQRQCKSTAFELLSCDTDSFLSKQKLFVDENRMDHISANVTESHFGNKNQENLAQGYQRPGTISCSSTVDGLQKENTTNVFPCIQFTSPFLNQKPPFLQTNNISQNFTSAYNSKVGISQTKPITPRLNHTLALSFGHLKTPISLQNISSADMRSSVKSQASEPKPPNVSCSYSNTENILNVVSETNSVPHNSHKETNVCSSKDDKVTNEAEAAGLKEATETVQRGACSLEKLHIMEIIGNLLNLEEQQKTETEFFMKRMKAIQNQKFEMLQKLSSVYQAAEVTDECKLSSSITEKSKASSSTDMNTEAEFVESEQMLVPIVAVSGKKKRRSSRIAAKINSSTRSSSGTPNPCDKSTAVVAIYKDLQKNFTFLRTPRNCKTPLQSKTLARTPRTVVSTSIRDQLLLLYDTDDSPQ